MHVGCQEKTVNFTEKPIGHGDDLPELVVLGPPVLRAHAAAAVRGVQHLQDQGEHQVISLGSSHHVREAAQAELQEPFLRHFYIIFNLKIKTV